MSSEGRNPGQPTVADLLRRARLARAADGTTSHRVRGPRGVRDEVVRTLAAAHGPRHFARTRIDGLTHRLPRTGAFVRDTSARLAARLDRPG